MNIKLCPSTSQPKRQTWSLRHLREARAIALGAALERSMARTYSSALVSYLSFCDSHNFSREPTPDTLSFFVVYMCHHIKPTSVASYLSGICSELEVIWPEVRTHRNSKLVSRTLAGCTKLFRTPATRKHPLMESDLIILQQSIPSTPSHDDLLFIAITFTGWHCLMRLGELVDPDSVALRSYRKTIDRCSIQFKSIPRPHVSFLLPMHKADRFYEGSTVVLEERLGSLDPLKIFRQYLLSRDRSFLHLPELWLHCSGKVPTQSWYIDCLRSLFPTNEIAGHSLRSGRATALALAGTPLHQIQAIG